MLLTGVVELEVKTVLKGEGVAGLVHADGVEDNPADDDKDGVPGDRV